jgi:hypothetical protein
MRVRRQSYDEANNAVAHAVRRHGREYTVLVNVAGQRDLAVKILDKKSGSMIYEGQAPLFGDRGEASDDFIGSLWWAERKIDEYESRAR